MKNRLKILRKTLDFTQQKFADQLGIARNNIAGYETGNRNPSDAVVSLICREFDVNENWLRAGEGNMFIEFDRDTQLAQWTEKILKESKSFKKRFLHVLSELNEFEWEVLEKMAIDMCEKKNTKQTSDVSDEISVSIEKSVLNTFAEDDFSHLTPMIKYEII